MDESTIDKKIQEGTTMKTVQATNLFYEAIKDLSLDTRYQHLIDETSTFIPLMLSSFLIILDDDRISRLIIQLKEHDKTTFLHSVDLFLLAGLFGLEKDETNISLLRGALLHDIGKLNTTPEILRKEARLTQEEYEKIKEHPTGGSEILLHLGYKYESTLARSHHERLDGTGYPDNLKEKQISFPVRLLGILDVYSALTLARPYKKAFTNQEAIHILHSDINVYDQCILDDVIKKLQKQKNTIS